MYCATSWNFAGQFPKGVTGIFHRPIPTGRTMALESAQSLTEMSKGKCKVTPLQARCGPERG
jgi:hypothetical protein